MWDYYQGSPAGTFCMQQTLRTEKFQQAQPCHIARLAAGVCRCSVPSEHLMDTRKGPGCFWTSQASLTGTNCKRKAVVLRGRCSARQVKNSLSSWGRYIARNNLMELVKRKFQSNILMLSSVSPGLVRLVRLCNNHLGKQMKFCHMKNGRIIWHIIQTCTFWNSSALAAGLDKLALFQI